MKEPDGRTENRVPWQSSITEVRKDELRTYGIDQRTIIREFSFEEMVFFLLKARTPDPAERTMLRAVLVAPVSHGITGQSTLAVMEAADCRTDFLHALIGGISVGAGDVHLGSTRAAMVELQHASTLAESELASYVEDRLASDRRFSALATVFTTRIHERACSSSSQTRPGSAVVICGGTAGGGASSRAEGNSDEPLRRRGGDPARPRTRPAGGPPVRRLGPRAMLAAVYLERLAQGRAPFQRIEVVDVLEEQGDG